MSTKLLAVGLDGAEISLLNELMGEGTLPNLSRLLAGGSLSKIQGPSNIASAAIWPTFMTGRGPESHSHYSWWVWDQDLMALNLHPLGFDAFWEQIRNEGHIVGTLDVPLASPVPAEAGFDVSSWAAHYTTGSRSVTNPSGLAEVTARRRHPHQEQLVRGRGPADAENLKRVLEDARSGLIRRTDLLLELIERTSPELTIAVYQELHHAGHYAWHTVVPDDEAFAGEETRFPLETQGMRSLYEEADRQLGRLLTAVPSDTTVMVFSLNGMQPSRGVPDFFTRLLLDTGYASLIRWRDLPSRQKLTAILRRAKRSGPRWLKRLYRRVATQELQRAVAVKTVIDPYDWSRTRAFSLPPEDYGVIRINLKGREQEGIVDPADYRALVDELSERLLSLTSAGQPIISRAITPVKEGEDPRDSCLPDLIAHWTPAAHALPLTVDGLGGTMVPFAPELTGHHNTDGWCFVNGPAAGLFPDVIEIGELHTFMAGCLTRETQDSGPV